MENINKSLNTLEKFVAENEGTAEAQKALQTKQELEQVYSDVFEGLKKAGMNENVANADAKIWQGMALFGAQETGLSPLEYIRQRMPKVEGMSFEEFQNREMTPEEMLDDYIPYQAMYKSKLPDFGAFYDDIIKNENTKDRYFTEDINGVGLDISRGAIFHDENGHQLSKGEWQGVINALKANKIKQSRIGDYSKMRGTPVKMVVDVNGVEYGIVFEHMQSGRNLISTVFVLTDKGWMNPKQKKRSQTEASKPLPQSRLLGNALPDIISALDENVNNVNYQFAGEQAQTAVLDDLSKAKELEAKGVDNEEIRKQTGWFKWVDNKWRYEISDKEAKFSLAGLNGKLGGKLSKFLKHPKLYKAYPDLRKIHILLTAKENEMGYYNPRYDMISLNKNLDETQMKDVVLHEIQHAIQFREGFAIGSDVQNQSFRDYRRYAGEIEARNTQVRANMNDAERRAVSPESTQDIYGSEAIVVFDDGSVAAYAPGNIYYQGGKGQNDLLLNRSDKKKYLTDEEVERVKEDTENFSEKIGSLEKGILPKREQIVVLSKLTSAFNKIEALKGRRLFISQDVYKKIVDIPNKFGKNHNVARERAVKLPELVADPDYILQSVSKGHEDRFVVVTKSRGKKAGLRLSVIIQPGTRDVIVSSYDEKINISEEKKAGRVLFDKKKELESEVSALNAEGLNNSYNDNIAPTRKNVNIYYQGRIADRVKEIFQPAFSDVKKFAETLKKAIRGELQRYTMLQVTSTTPEVYKALGIADKPLNLPQNVLKKINVGKHNVSLSVIEKLPELVSNPLFILDSKLKTGVLSQFWMLQMKAEIR